MASFRGLSCSIAFCSLIIIFFFVPLVSAQLSPTFYNTSCPNALSIIRTAVRAAVTRDRRMGASLLRLHFHDCFVQAREKTANPNNNSLRGFEVIDAIKSKLESACKQVVSCADIVAVAARDSVVAVVSRDLFLPPERSIPSSKLHVIPAGAHTIGQARCFLFRARVYNDTNIDPSFALSLRSNCSSSGGDNERSPLDSTTPTVFDNDYYANLVRERGLLHTDQQLFMNGGGSMESQVSSYARNSAKFFSDFASAMVKMGSISPLTGSTGEIRINCRKIN
ncbi:hypothetical protein BHM03_00044504 [Ensete ventricosum]|nr:hypothetical protein BHM03_00044504 [Ensete ventricosum]